MPGELSLAVCDDCFKQKGKAPVKAWITLLIALVMMIVCVIFSGRAASVNVSVAVYSGLLSVSAITMIVAVYILLFKARNEMNRVGMFFALFFGFLPPINLLMLAIMAKKINRCARAESALKPVAEKMLGTERDTDSKPVYARKERSSLTEDERQAINERK